MRGQDEAERFLMDKGMEILERNYRVKSGEIDIIARDGEYVVFVEVKYRSGVGYVYPREAVGAAKQHRIRKTSLYYIAQHPDTGCGYRYDVVEVLRENGQMAVTHLEDAFQWH
jgi:putative endonuclease